MGTAIERVEHHGRELVGPRGYKVRARCVRACVRACVRVCVHGSRSRAPPSDIRPRPPPGNAHLPPPANAHLPRRRPTLTSPAAAVFRLWPTRRTP
eukprot:1953163-Prymnesium_polylepis.1